MKIIRRKLDTLIRDPGNARAHSSPNLEAIRRSLAQFGQSKPIVIDRNGVVVCGNGTLEAAQLLGLEALDCVVSPLSAAKNKALSIADNRTQDLSNWDNKALAALVKELDSADLDSIGFSTADLDVLTKSLASLPALPEGEFDSLGGSDAEGQPMPAQASSAPAVEVFNLKVVCLSESLRRTLRKRLENSGYTCEEI